MGGTKASKNPFPFISSLSSLVRRANSHQSKKKHNQSKQQDGGSAKDTAGGAAGQAPSGPNELSQSIPQGQPATPLPHKKSRVIREHSSRLQDTNARMKGPTVHDSVNLLNIDTSSVQKQQEGVGKQHQSTPQKGGKAGLSTHKNKQSFQKMSPNHQKAQKIEPLQIAPGQAGQHHSSLTQHKLNGESIPFNQQNQGFYRLNGQPFHLPSSHTPVFIKGKVDGLVSSSLCTTNNTFQVIALGQHLIPNKGMGSPFISSTQKSQVVDDFGGSYDNYVDVHKNLGAIGLMDGDTPDGSNEHLPHSFSQNPKTIFNSNQKPKHSQLPMPLSAVANDQKTPRRHLHGKTYEDNQSGGSSAYTDVHKSASLKVSTAKRQVGNPGFQAGGGSLQNYYFKKGSHGQQFNQHQQFTINQNMMVQGKNQNQLHMEMNNQHLFGTSHMDNNQIYSKTGKHLAWSQDSRPLTGQNVVPVDTQAKQPRLDAGINNKSTHILLPQKDQLNEIQFFNNQNGNKGQPVGVVGKHLQNNNNLIGSEQGLNKALMMSVQRANRGFEMQKDNTHIVKLEQEKYVRHLESQEREKQLNLQEVVQLEGLVSQPPVTVADNYKSLQVNRSNTTTGYMSGMKTHVQLSQNLQHSANQHLTANGMNVVASGIPQNLVMMKQSFTEEKPNESARLVKDQSDTLITPNRIPMNNKNSQVRKLVSNFKVHGKRAQNESIENKNPRTTKVFKHKRNSQNQQMPLGQADMLAGGNADKNGEFKDYPVSDPSRNIYLNRSTSKVQENFCLSSKEMDGAAHPQKEPQFQIQPAVVFSAKTTVPTSNNLNMNTVEDEIFQNNGRQIAEGYNSFKMAQLLNKEHNSQKSKSSVAQPTVQSHQLNMQLFEMQFLKGQDNIQQLGVHKIQLQPNQVPPNWQQNNVGSLKEQVQRQQQKLVQSPGKPTSIMINPKTSQQQFGLQKNQTFGGYTYNASKPNNLIYSVHHHIQNVQDQLQSSSVSQNTATSLIAPVIGVASSKQQQPQPSSILYHKPTNSSSILALQNQNPSTVRQDQLILQNAIKAQNQKSPLIIGLQQQNHQQSTEKKLIKVKDIQNLTTNNSLLPYPALPLPNHTDPTILPQDDTTHLPPKLTHALLPAPGTAIHPTTVVFQNGPKPLGKGGLGAGIQQQGTQSSTQIGKGATAAGGSQKAGGQVKRREEELSGAMSGINGVNGQLQQQQVRSNQLDVQVTKGIHNLQQAIQNLWAEQERVVGEIFTQNKHIEPNSLNLIIQSQLNTIKMQQSQLVQGQKFVQPFRNNGIYTSQVIKQHINQIDVMNNYKLQLEGLQALKNLQEFLEVSTHQNIQQLLQNRSRFMMQGNHGTIGIPQSLVKQLHPKKPPTDLYGNPINTDKQKSKIPFENAYVEDCYKYIVMPGNNSQLIRKALERRSWWIEIQPVHSLYNFRWQPISHGIRFDKLSARQPKHGENYGMSAQVTTFNATMGGGPQTQNENQDSHKATTLSELNHRQMVNHLEFHQLITEKFNLLQSMQKFCDLNKENVFDFLPVTFYIEMPNFQKENAYNSAMQPFIQYFQVLEEHKRIIHELKQELVKLQEKEDERERLLAEQRELEHQEDGSDEQLGDNPNSDAPNDQPNQGFKLRGNEAVDGASDSETGADGDRGLDKNDDGMDMQDQSKAEDDEDQDGGKKKEKGLLQSQPGFSTVYKTPGKENPNNKSTKFKSFNFEKRNHMRLTCPVSHFDGHNLWLLKPTHLNRGRGIHVFNDLNTLHKLIKEYCVGKDEESWKKKSKVMTEKQQRAEEDNQNNEKNEENPKNNAQDDDGNMSPFDGTAESPLRKSTTKIAKEHTDQHSGLHGAVGGGAFGSPDKKQKTNCYKIKHNTFIIQKYIERPLLICQRKFDIRVWVLLDQEHNLYLFKEGYIRTSASIFSIDSNHIDNAAVHLTNNAVQKALDSYGQFEDGNQLSYDRFQDILLQEQPECGIDVRRDIVPAMKYQIMKSIYSVRKTIDPYKRKYCFELFGYDFIIDEDFNTWLIEVNTNPCLEESSQMLKSYLPRMIEDMLKLTIDQIFPRVTKKKRFPVGGHGSNHKDSHGSPIKLKNRKLSSVGGPSNGGALTTASKHVKASSKLSKQVTQIDALKKRGDTSQNVTSPKNADPTNTEAATKRSPTQNASPHLPAPTSTKDTSAGLRGKSIDTRDEVKQKNGEISEEDVAAANDAVGEEELEERRALDMAAKYARRIHPVKGYTDSENMWEKMLNIEKTPICPMCPLRFQNNKHRFNIAIQDKVFKIKKNPTYTPYKEPEKVGPSKSTDGPNEDQSPTTHEQYPQKNPLQEVKKIQHSSASHNENLVAQAQQQVMNSKKLKQNEQEEKSKLVVGS